MRNINMFWKEQYNTANSNLFVWELIAYKHFHIGEILRSSMLKSSNIMKRLKLLKISKFIEPTRYGQRLMHNVTLISESSFHYAIGLENLIKGQLVKKLETSGEKLDSRLKNHNLDELMDILEISISDKERTFLKVCTELIIWRGRYPIPLSANKYPGEQSKNKMGLVGGSPTYLIEPSFHSVLLKLQNLE